MTEGHDYLWVGDTLVAGTAAGVSPADRGLLYGDGVYETLRAYGGRLFRLRDHMMRLARGLERLQMAGIEGMLAARAALGALPPLPTEQDSRVRVTLTRGPGGHPFDLHVGGVPTLAIQVRPLAPMGEALPAGISVLTAAVRRNETSPLSRIKSLNCLDNILARATAKGAGYDDALFLNTQGRVAEATSSNLFAMIAGELVTPPPSQGLLPGIARAVIMELMPVVERPVTCEDLADADEVFITNSVAEVVPVTAIDDDPVGTGEPGPMTRAIHAAYRAAVRADAP